MGIYRKYHSFIEKWLFPLILSLYPFLTVNQGLDVADSTYSLTNFQYFDTMNGTWMVATFLSNAAGWLLMHLPFGGTLLGMKCYATLSQSAVALMVYFGLRKRIAAPLLFLGEFLALGLCWCPSTVLYNYLTYLLMTAGILLLYRGLTEDRETSWKRRRPYFAAAGVCLGANVAVRMPNVVQAAFILAVWYGIVLRDRRLGGKAALGQAGDITDVMGDAGSQAAGNPGRTGSGTGGRETEKRLLPWSALLEVTGWCLLGYVVGFGVPFAGICVRYGITAYPDMVRTMFAMTEQAVDYKPTSMLTGMLGDYIKGLYWLVFAGVCAAAAGLAFFARERLYGAGKKAGQQGRGEPDARAGGQTGSFFGEWNAYQTAGIVIKIAYILLLLVLLRFYWGRGMFHFRYYQYGNGSIYYPAVLLLLVTITAAVHCLIGKRVRAERKILAAFVLLQIFLTPLGSNNDLYPIINNLFLAAPFLLWVIDGSMKGSAETRQRNVAGRENEGGRWKSGAAYGFVWRAPVVLLILFVMVQSIGSHANFVFQDGIYGEPREKCVETPEKAAGVYTTLENGALLEELSAFIEEEGLTGREMIAYDELPGLYYLLDMPPALSTGWPDLSSYRMTEYTRDLEETEAESRAGKELPVIIVSSAVAAYWSDDGEAINWFGVDMEEMAKDEKQRILWDFARGHGYTEVFGNARYAVYVK